MREESPQGGKLMITDGTGLTDRRAQLFRKLTIVIPSVYAVLAIVLLAFAPSKAQLALAATDPSAFAVANPIATWSLAPVLLVKDLAALGTIVLAGLWIVAGFGMFVGCTLYARSKAAVATGALTAAAGAAGLYAAVWLFGLVAQRLGGV
ncbi:hypothetical protein AHiyo8_pI69810 (plasmid) [Arthrobacter sp. Hiyo8]|uniref:hypothetical protein n=1 Tax=Arthrobacter sp. Hiyo1 TaxID=1588020 RepID=UPI000683ABA7|nr:hypothetical protein [Arthrobacter sp. Hiyo1]BAS18677.1 hypothetical protein AHiyo8_pI69810 [Arthrobacter sp. Hiyo8]GAP60814.1 hypothetical protein AHiyo1_44080 [Arthrobacter sp. Hiyo1]